MYIKQIIIQGFKSYKEQTVMEPFSPGTNVVVGRNGSGKSNFFAAIRFVLSDAYQQMGREERQALLHEGSGSAVMSAYVEIIFDNSDRRFATQNDEVVIRRTIGLKKDEYSLDRKAVPKSEVMSLLEGAGFSKANPYYIVPQGRVTALTNMKEGDRLTLLKEIAGTNTYESRRVESLKIMTDTQNKRDKITQLLVYIKERLTELEEEKEELRGFQEKDRERRCLEYAYWHQQQEKIAAALAEIEETRLDGAGASSKDRQLFQRGETEISELQHRINALEQVIQELDIERGQLSDDRRKAAKINATAEMKAKHLAETRQEREQAQQQQEAELAEVRRQIQAKEKELAQTTPEYEKWQAEEAKVKEKMDMADARCQMLLTKQSLGSRFKSKDERDKYLQKELTDLQLSIGHRKAARTDSAELLEEADAEIARLERDIQDIRGRLSNYGGNRDSLDEELTKAREKREQLDEKKKGLKREGEKLRSRIASTAAELSQAEGELRHAMDVPTAKGLATIRRLKQERDIPGAYGTLAELMTVPQEAYRLCVEQVAGASLFHYIVDNERTGTMLADHLYSQFGGRLTIVPLAQLRPRQLNMPKASDAQPLIGKIEFDPAYEKAFQHIFGHTVVCPNLPIASQYARSHGVDGITLDGDTTNKRGAMTGGYVDAQRSRLLAVQKVNRLRDLQDEQLAQSRQNRAEIEALEQEITSAIGEVQKLEQNRSRLNSGYDTLKADLRNNDRQLDVQRERREKIAAQCAQVESDMKQLDDQITAYQTEMGSDFKRALTAQEERQLHELEEQIDASRKGWNEVSNKRRALQTRMQGLEVALRKNLKPQEDELSSRAFENLSSSTGNDRDAQKELKKAQKAAAAAQKKWEENEKRKEETTGELAKLEAQKLDKEREQTDLARRIERQQKLIEKNVEKKALLTTQAAESAKNIKDLGVVPEEAFVKYARMKADQISSRLKKVNEALKKYKHVNKKAFEQYNSFTIQQDHLLKRQKELDTSKGSIEELIKHLDQAKDEAIERTFKQVSREFSTIFERLVPAGHGRLVIQRRAKGDKDGEKERGGKARGKDRGKNRNAEAEESDDESKGTVDSYAGVGISVSFNSKVFDEQQKIQQLSGGQKSLCALCLIFAIQATETSPMVIFDEVDANLDAQYRTAVASLLASTSKESGTQFICTTFRPEILHVADKCYGVTFRNKTSTIECVPAEEALNFVEGQRR